MLKMPDPTGGIHLAVSRTRLGQINDAARNGVLVKALKTALKSVQKANPTCLFLSELSLMPILAAKLGAGQVFVAEGNRQMRAVIEKYVAKEADELRDKIVVTLVKGLGVTQSMTFPLVSALTACSPAAGRARCGVLGMNRPEV